VAGPGFEPRRHAPAEVQRRRIRRYLAGRADQTTSPLSRRTSDTRIKELLKIANWLAAPFGTEEYLFRKFGIPGVHYNMVNNSPVQTQAGITQTVLGIRYLVDAPT